MAHRHESRNAARTEPTPSVDRRAATADRPCLLSATGSPEVLAQALLEQLEKNGSQQAAVDRILELVEQSPENDELCIDLLPRLSRDQLEDAVARSPESGYVVVEAALSVERVGPRWNNRSFRWADSVTLSLLYVASAAAQSDELELLEKAAKALFAWDGSWDQWPPQGPIRQWLVALRSAAAGVVAQALSEEPDSARHFSEVASDSRADRRIRDAIRRATEG